MVCSKDGCINSCQALCDTGTLPVTNRVYSLPLNCASESVWLRKWYFGAMPPFKGTEALLLSWRHQVVEPPLDIEVRGDWGTEKRGSGRKGGAEKMRRGHQKIIFVRIQIFQNVFMNTLFMTTFRRRKYSSLKYIQEYIQTNEQT